MAPKYVSPESAHILSRRGSDERAWLEAVDGVVEAFCTEKNYIPIEVKVASATLGAVILASDSAGHYVVLKSLYSEQNLIEEKAWLMEAGPDVAPVVLDSDAHTVVLEHLFGTHEPSEQEVAGAVIGLMLRESTMASVGLPLINVDVRTARVIQRLRTGDPARVLAYRRVSDLVHGTLLDSIVSRPSVVHGDLRSANMIFNSAGQVKFINPVPALATAAYDGAYWASDWMLGPGLAERVEYLAAHSTVELLDLVAWAAHHAGYHLSWWEHFYPESDMSGSQIIFDEAMKLAEGIFAAGS
jgi:hypothetical protein